MIAEAHGTEMPLEPGTHGIVSVEPLRVREEHASGEWSCSICGRMHPVASTWVLTFRPDGGPDLRFILCPDCGRARRPVLAVVDRAGLARDPDLADVRDHIESIARARDAEDDRYLPIRDADLYDLASERDVAVGEFLDDLGQRDILRRRKE